MMTLIRESKLKVRDISVGKLEPNPWNPNRMNDETYAKLRAYLDREGFVEPIVVRKLKSGMYQILGGHHRWKIAQDLGLEVVPCVVVDLNDRRAKILSVNLNEMKGQSAPDLMAELVHDLTHDLSLEDLETQLPYDLADLRDLVDLLKIPDGLSLELEKEAEELERDRVRIMSFPLTSEQTETVQNALDEAKDAGGSSRSAALTHIAQAFLAGARGDAK